MASPTGIEVPSIQSGVDRRGSDTGAASPQTWTLQRPCFGAGFGSEKSLISRSHAPRGNATGRSAPRGAERRLDIPTQSVGTRTEPNRVEGQAAA